MPYRVNLLWDRLSSLSWCLLLPALSSCNTDALFRDPAEPFGPVVAWPKAGPIEDPDVREVDIVESLVGHRNEYHRTLASLGRLYAERGNEPKRRMVEDERAGLDRVLTFKYMLDAEIPPASLTSTEQIDEADRLYIRGYDLLRRGGHGIPALYREELMIKALKTFKTLIEQYPTSDKIDDAAFYCGEIHSGYLPDQELIAVRWYERAWQWDPQTPHPARFRAARLYDLRLQDRARALELYHAVTHHEAMNTAHVRVATGRIQQLSR